MRVLFDGHWLVSKGPISGRVVVRSFLGSWVEEFPQDEVVVAVPHDDVAAARALVGEGVGVVATRLRPHGVSCALELPRLARRHGPFDVILVQNYTPLAGPAVTFVHDVLFQSNPQWFTPLERAYFAGMPVLARRARAVLTSSRHEAERIRRHNPALATVEPIGLGLSTDLTDAEPEAVEGLDDFILSVGRLNVRKNLTATIEGTLASGVLSPRFPLVVVGEPEGRTAEHSPAVSAAIADGRVLFLGGVSDAQLAWLYGRARLFVYLSLDEGFGFPPLEALHFGCPVVVSDLPVFRETVADAGVLVPPSDRDAIAAAVAEAVRGPKPQVVPRDVAWRDVVHAARTAVTAAIG
ncbi:glycosyltransferase family 4 protein [Aeromicrobium sp. zg-636]|uniref:Glycosyltransferase family 4 protein n=1 Tax=Aeromicrobium senzhongii TaxID=2663859 RepID=A0A8I0K1Z3_9ACTN|nr:glycosyltransferase family 1 protein [Aeromicrobium sp. 636]MBC9227573.1 glycosyltransferase family 4 protein [Aeromicrobium senzhongii]